MRPPAGASTGERTGNVTAAAGTAGTAGLPRRRHHCRPTRGSTPGTDIHVLSSSIRCEGRNIDTSQRIRWSASTWSGRWNTHQPNRGEGLSRTEETRDSKRPRKWHRSREALLRSHLSVVVNRCSELPPLTRPNRRSISSNPNNSNKPLIGRIEVSIGADTDEAAESRETMMTVVRDETGKLIASYGEFQQTVQRNSPPLQRRTSCQVQRR